MDQLIHTSPFEKIRHQDERGKEYWEPHELGKLLGYSSWHAFQNTLIKARFSCEHSKQFVLDHFYILVDVKIARNGSLRKTEGVHLSQYLMRTRISRSWHWVKRISPIRLAARS